MFSFKFPDFVIIQIHRNYQYSLNTNSLRLDAVGAVTKQLIVIGLKIQFYSNLGSDLYGI